MDAVVDHPLIISALPTPFDDRLRIDREGFTDLLQRLPDDHRDVLVAGTTGEFPALERMERADLIRIAVDQLGEDRVIAHVGSASLAESCRLTELAAQAGVRRVALLTPYFLPVDQTQVIEYFHSFAEASPEVEVYAYIFPERTGVTVEPDTFAALMEPPNIIGAKLSGAANDHFSAYLARTRDDQVLYTGDDSRLASIRAEGGAGVVSGCFPVLPGAFTESIGDADAIGRVVGTLGPSIARQKLALRMITGRPWGSRMSMPTLPQSVIDEIAALVARYGGSGE
jgi:4-hydroxy-tetrahydrodipicolinate synthase